MDHLADIGRTSTQTRLEDCSNSTSATATAVVATLRDLGAGRVSDAFVIPISQAHATQEKRTTLVTNVRHRQHQHDCFIRIADVPFDLLTFRRLEARQGAWFSLGPAVLPLSADAGSVEGSRRALHPAVLLLQVEDDHPKAALAADKLQEGLGRLGVHLQRCDIKVERRGNPWQRVCLAGTLPVQNELQMIWTGDRR